MPTRRGAIVATALGALVATAAGRSFRRLAIAEHSMEPALSSGDYVLARVTRAPQRGDIVTFRHPDRPGMLLVKRIVGLPGERVVIANGQVHVDGETLAEPWANGPTLPPLEFEASDHDVIVLSDNRSATLADSRTFGPIPVAAVEHKVVVRYWPPAAIGRPG
jgi:signal peptidase I